jgi:hypothetical protein
LSSQRPRPAIGESGTTRSRTAISTVATRPLEARWKWRCWPAQRRAGNHGKRRESSDAAHFQGVKRTHVVLWGTPALSGRVKVRFTPRNRRRPCGKLAKPQKPRPCKGLDHPQGVQGPSTGDPCSHVRPDRGHGQIPHRHQPILRHTGGSDGQASAFPALLYDDVRGLFPQGCIHGAMNTGHYLTCPTPRSAIFHTGAVHQKTRERSRNCAEPKPASPGGDCRPRTIQNRARLKTSETRTNPP